MYNVCLPLHEMDASSDKLEYFVLIISMTNLGKCELMPNILLNLFSFHYISHVII
jgi:hypothetical protein